MPKSDSPSRRKLRKKATQLFNQSVRALGKCERCGKTQNLQCSHVYTVKSYPWMAFTPENALCLCSSCHIFWWHKSVMEAYEWFRENYPSRYDYLQGLRANREAVDYEEVIERYTVVKEVTK